jgi:hypothetical protein
MLPIALEEAMKELKVQESVIITFEDNEDVSVSTGVIHVIPAWR